MVKKKSLDTILELIDKKRNEFVLTHKANPTHVLLPVRSDIDLNKEIKFSGLPLYWDQETNTQWHIYQDMKLIFTRNVDEITILTD